MNSKFIIPFLIFNESSSLRLQDKNVMPTTSNQTITADAGYDGIGTVTIDAVTSTIDDNITAANIKKDVMILGVTGTFEADFSGVEAALEDIINGDGEY